MVTSKSDTACSEQKADGITLVGIIDMVVRLVIGIFIVLSWVRLVKYVAQGPQYLLLLLF